VIFRQTVCYLFINWERIIRLNANFAGNLLDEVTRAELASGYNGTVGSEEYCNMYCLILHQRLTDGCRKVFATVETLELEK
jgi:hypothetical protein